MNVDHTKISATQAVEILQEYGGPYAFGEVDGYYLLVGVDPQAGTLRKIAAVADRPAAQALNAILNTLCFSGSPEDHVVAMDQFSQAARRASN